MSEEGLNDSESCRQPGSSHLPIMVLMAGVINRDGENSILNTKLF